MRGIAILFALLATLTPVAAQTLVTSTQVDSVSVTLYREPGRGEGAIRAGWPGGYALITETRTIALPTGRSVIRFEGVSEGTMPETAIVTGLPRRVNEKNRDARLLSPAALVDAYLKRSVTITRTDRATGAVKVEDAIIQSGPGGGVVLTTVHGVEALGCSGLPERLSYPGVPEDLSAKPTLSVVADSKKAATATVQLSYLAQGFDWATNYVASVSADGKTLDLFAWLTVANGGSQGFANANTQAVAGRLHREPTHLLPKAPPPALHLECWPMDITSTYPKWSIDRAPPAPRMLKRASFEIVATASRRDRKMMAPPPPPPPPAPPPDMMAQQEDLGDLKLYRIPEPVTVAAQSRKQVKMIDRKGVPFDRIYTGDFSASPYAVPGEMPSRQAALVLRTENRDAKGLGLALPAGAVAVFEAAGGKPMLVGESNLADRAVGEEIQFGAGMSDDLRYVTIVRPRKGKHVPFVVRVTNARSTPETFELTLPPRLASTNGRLVERKGRKVWRVVVPANGTASLDLTLERWG